MTHLDYAIHCHHGWVFWGFNMPSWDQEAAMTLIPIPRTLDIYGHGKLKPQWPMITMAFILSLPSWVSWGFYMLWWDQGAMGLNPILIPWNLDLYVHEIEVTMADGGYGIHCVICLSHRALTCMMRSRGHGFKSNSNSMKLRYISMGLWEWSHNDLAYFVQCVLCCHKYLSCFNMPRGGSMGFCHVWWMSGLGRFYPLY